MSLFRHIKPLPIDTGPQCLRCGGWRDGQWPRAFGMPGYPCCCDSGPCCLDTYPYPDWFYTLTVTGSATGVDCIFPSNCNLRNFTAVYFADGPGCSYQESNLPRNLGQCNVTGFIPWLQIQNGKATYQMAHVDWWPVFEVSYICGTEVTDLVMPLVSFTGDDLCTHNDMVVKLTVEEQP